MQNRSGIGGLTMGVSRRGASDGSNVAREKRNAPARLDANQVLLRSNHLRSHQADLIECIRTRIIPQLARTHGLVNKPELVSMDTFSPTQPELTAFADLAVHKDVAVVVAHLNSLMARGVPIESVYLNWIAAAARQMGCDWESDRADFSAVTHGMWTLQQALHRLSPVFLRAEGPTKTARRALLASVPGEQHTLGLCMVSEFFRRAGWDTWTELPSDYDEVIGKARDEWFDLVGLSAGCDHKIDALAQAIVTLRRASRNAEVVVMVGGPIFANHPEIALTVGADFTAVDAVHAVAKAEQMVATRVSEQSRR